MTSLKTMLIGAGMATMLLASCGNGGKTFSGLDPAKFDTVINEKPVKLYTLTNKKGVEACITNFGGRVVSLMVPDRNGNFIDVVLGYDNIAQYADTVNSPSDFGATIGRYANRINKGQITVAGQKYQLPTNNFGHCLHGGPSGWQYQVWDAEQIDDQTLKLTLVSPDGDNGFPGTVTATATYKITDDDALDCTFEATTDKETVINMCNHSYFTLTGDPSKPGTNMELYVNADKMTPIDTTYMTTGEMRDVYGSSLDYKKPRALYEMIADTTEHQIKYANGYDHNYVLNTYKDGKGNDQMVAASLYDKNTGIFMQVFTNEPGIQVYTGNFQGTGIVCKNGIKYPKQVSVCLETQKFPDSPNKVAKGWPSPYLKPGEKYFSHCVYKFSTK
ncbi:MAG: galactose mutarotase [Prevotella sp.]|nr:galactose mutarotase [Prevotella sp.]MBR0527930.1 galactose mutarotase [Prevotella sp.]MBR3010919.1 galactose mutarotase [Prevotella sp.]